MSNYIKCCPNCGAKMHIKGLDYVCDFCGTQFTNDNYIKYDSQDSSKREKLIASIYEDIQKNKNYIMQSKYIELTISDNLYKLKSSPNFFANDGNYNKVFNFSFFLLFETDGHNQSFFIGVETKEYFDIPSLTFLINSKILIKPKYERRDNHIAYFLIDIKEFFGLCICDDVDVSLSFFDTSMSYFDEFQTYCHRFFHYVIDKRKYYYSIFKHLITD